ncbi:MAG: S49 family peptidase, partial [Muribaculaceae bacterium]|nr:S49 family peptidase [Muribaculaceae bacterium]
YELFTARVAQGRGMPQDSVKAIAEGRVWTGGRALQLGLVDKIGSLRDAIDAMADECGLESDEFVQYPVTEEKIWDAILRESGKLDVAITGELDPSTLKALNTIKRLRQAAPIQARMEDIEIH